jgi:uncharacterized protein with PIN domain
MSSVKFKFHGSLNDFLLPRNRDSWNTYTFTGSPSIKDAIEAIGIPHVEVCRILINEKEADFTHALHGHAMVEVFPYTQISAAPLNFVLDVHLGKLARQLRLLGFDSLYQNNYTDRNIIDLVKQQERIVLTRDIGLLKHTAIQWGYWLRSQQPLAQLEEIVYRFHLEKEIHPFSRCLVCNGPIESVAKYEIRDQLPPATLACFDEFYQCHQCKKLYWKGSHYDRMIKLVSAIS